MVLIDRVERVLRIVGIDRIQRVIETKFVERVEDVVVALVFFSKARLR